MNIIPDSIKNNSNFEIIKPLGLKVTRSMSKGTLIPHDALAVMRDSCGIAAEDPMLDTKNFSVEQRRQKWMEYKRVSQSLACVDWSRSHFDKNDLPLLFDVSPDDEKFQGEIFRHAGTEHLARIWIGEVLTDIKNNPQSTLLYRCVQKSWPIRETILSILEPEEMLKFMEESSGLIMTAFVKEFEDRTNAVRAAQSFSKYQTMNSDILHQTFDSMPPEELQRLMAKRKVGYNAKEVSQEQHHVRVDLTKLDIKEREALEEEYTDECAPDENETDDNNDEDNDEDDDSNVESEGKDSDNDSQGPMKETEFENKQEKKELKAD